MITLPNKRDEDKVTAAISNPDGYELRLGLYIEGEEITTRLTEGTWGQSEIPITLDATIAGNLPDRFRNGEVNLFAQIDGVTVPQLYSGKSVFLPPEEYGLTEIIASSPGSLLAGDDAIKLDAITDYPGISPENIIRDITRRLPYNQGRIRIDPITIPELWFQGSGEQPGFQAEEATGDVLSRVGEEVGYRFRDTVFKGLRAYVPIPLARNQETNHRHYLSGQLSDWLPPTDADVRYFQVTVFKRTQSGDIAYSATALVPYPGWVHPPFQGQTKFIPLEEDVGDSPQNAQLRANTEALRLGHGQGTGTLTLPAYDPLVELEDRFIVEGPYEDDDGLWEKQWIARVDAYQHVFGTDSASNSTNNADAVIQRFKDTSSDKGSLDTVVSYTSLLLQADKVRVPTLLLGSLGREPRRQAALVLFRFDAWGTLAYTGASDLEGAVQLTNQGRFLDPQYGKNQIHLGPNGLSIDVV